MRDAWRQGWAGAVFRQVAVTVAYAICYSLLRDVSVSHWSLQAGLRVLCLALLPYRYWPSVMVGEALPLGWQGWLNHERFGTLWACTLAVPAALLCAPPFAWCRRRMPLMSRGEVNIPALMVFILVGAVVTALASTLSLSLMRMPPGQAAPEITMHVVLTYFLGCYLGTLTVAPAALAAWQGFRWRAGLAGTRGQAFIRDTLTGVLPPLSLLAWLASRTEYGELVEVARMAMFLPVVWMTLRHGWRGAAIAGALASVAVELTVTAVRDPAVIQAQTLIAFAVSSLLMLGARLARSDASPAARSAREDELALRGFQLAQQGLYQEEQRLRQVAESLERLGQSMRDGQRRMIERLRPVLPESVGDTYARHIDLTQMEMHRLANALHPRTWREQGLAATFEEGPLAQAASLAGASYRCELSGSGLRELAPDVHMMLYRQACEVLVYLLAREPLRHVHVHIRGGHTRGRRWVVLRLRGMRVAVTQRGRSVPEWRQIVSLLGTNGQGMTTIRERALIYGGLVHEHGDETQLGVSLLLHDALRTEPSMKLHAPLSRVVSA